MRGVFQMPKAYLEWIKKAKSKKKDYVMRNKQNGVEIRCTEPFVKHWKKRGFEVVAIKPHRPILKVN